MGGHRVLIENGHVVVWARGSGGAWVHHTLQTDGVLHVTGRYINGILEFYAPPGPRPPHSAVAQCVGPNGVHWHQVQINATDHGYHVAPQIVGGNPADAHGNHPSPSLVQRLHDDDLPPRRGTAVPADSINVRHAASQHAAEALRQLVQAAEPPARSSTGSAEAHHKPTDDDFDFDYD